MIINTQKTLYLHSYEKNCIGDWRRSIVSF